MYKSCVSIIRKCIFKAFIIKDFIMIQLYTQEEYDNAKSEDKLKFKCEQCGKEFYEPKKWIKFCLTHANKNGRLRFCSNKCDCDSRNLSHYEKCTYCGKDIIV